MSFGGHNAHAPTYPVDDAALAGRIATGAGTALLRLRGEIGDGRPHELRDAGDRLAHEFILERLRRWRPDDAVLSEEGADDRRRLDADRVWIVDPLDGTREFAERTDDDGRTGWRDDWAVHVALWTRGRGLTAGAVSIPARAQTFVTRMPSAVSVTPPASPPSPRTADPRRIRLAVSRSHPAPVAAFLAERFGVQLVPMGSAGVKTMAVLTGEVDGYVHDGGQFEWDSAAPVAVAIDAGLVAHRLDGSAPLYNRPNPWLPDLAVCAPHLAAELGSWLDTYRHSDRKATA